MEHPPQDPKNYLATLHTPGRDAETFARVTREAVNAWLDDQTPRWVHMELVLEEVRIPDTTRALDIVTRTLDEHPDYHRLATGSRPFLVDGDTYAWCVWERDVDEDARVVSPEPALGASV